jgi:O-antigen ligase
MNTFRLKSRYIWQNAEKWLIILFLATFALNIHKVFLTPLSFLNGTFNEYMTPSYSWADLLMLTVIIIYTIKWFIGQLGQRLPGKSILQIVIRFKSSVIRNFYIVSRETFIIILFLIWIGLSIFWSQYRLVALYRFTTFLEISLFAAIVVKSLKKQKWLEMALFALIFNGLFQSILGITQFIRNKSMGIHWIGESVLGPTVDGVAKISIEGEKHIRAYGTFPHPNILAGFLIIPIFIIFVSILTKCKLVNDQRDKVSRGTFADVLPAWSLAIILIIISLGFFLTFSRSAFLGLIISLSALCFCKKGILFKKIHPLLILFVFLAMIIGVYLICANKNLTSILSTQSLEERNLYQNVARETISTHPIKGVGLGQFVFEEFQKYPKLEGWQYQPVHNVYFLIFSELGFTGLIYFLLWIFSILEWEIGKERITGVLLTRNVFYCILISYLFIFLFDHYFWDIKIGIIIFTLPIIFTSLSTQKDRGEFE